MNQAIKKVGILASLFLVAMSLNACSHLTGKDAVVRNYNNDYRYAKSIPPLNMPPGVKLANVNSTYPVPSNLPPYAGAPGLIPPGNAGAAGSSSSQQKK